MQRYRKKPEIVEAVEITASTVDSVAQWCGGTVVPGKDWEQALLLNTTDRRSVNVGDFVIKNSEGMFYWMDAQSFRASFDPVEDD